MSGGRWVTLGLLGVALTCTAALAGPSQAVPVNDKPTPKAKQKTPRRAKGLGKHLPHKSSPRAARNPAFQMDPGAKWACDKQAVTLEPTWRGPQSLTFEFDIRNEGTADLRIKARGG